jgi:hypothetical protein
VNILDRIEHALTRHRSDHPLVIYLGRKECQDLECELWRLCFPHDPRYDINGPERYKGNKIVRVNEDTWLAVGPAPSGTQNGTITTPESNLQPRGDSGQ